MLLMLLKKLLKLPTLNILNKNSKYIMEMIDFDSETLQLSDVNGDGICDLYDAIEIAKTLLP